MGSSVQLRNFVGVRQDRCHVICGVCTDAHEPSPNDQPRTCGPKRGTNAAHTLAGRLTMKLSDARLRRRETKLIYPDHRPTPCPSEVIAQPSLKPIVR